MLEAILNGDWGLAALEACNGNSAAIQAQKKAINKCGYSFHQRVYIDAGHWAEQGLKAPAVFFWRGSPVLNQGLLPTLRVLLDRIAKENVGICPVVSTFHPGYPPNYNARRHSVPLGVLENVWRDLLRIYSSELIEYGCIDNEPLSGDAAYSVSAYQQRAEREAWLLRDLGVTPLVYHKAQEPLRDDHVAIRGEVIGSPPFASYSENWLLPGVPGKHYAEFARACRESGTIKVLGLNFGAFFVPEDGLVWGSRRYDTTWLWNERGWTPTGDQVLAVLDRTISPGPAPTPGRVLIPKIKLERMEDRLYNRVSIPLDKLIAQSQVGMMVQAEQLRPIKRQVDREIARLKEWAS